MITTTTDFIPGREIDEILGVVHGFSMRGFATILSSFTDPSRIKTMVGEAMEVKNDAWEDMLQQAAALGADAVICIRFAPSSFEYDNALKFESTAYGTAVRLK
jgi:uncharacterized protein YbjQ (UPF0145 family)